jgi:hypothetical protein
MFFDALNEYCAEGTGGADIFACTAAQATFGIYHGDARSILSFALLYHFDCAVGTVTLAVVAADAILVGDAVVGYPHCRTNFCGAFLFGNDRLDGPVGTDVGTGGAGGTAEAALERHFGLHQAVEAARWAQHVVGTL